MQARIDELAFFWYSILCIVTFAEIHYLWFRNIYSWYNLSITL